MTDLSQFHYYDVPQTFTAHFSVEGEVTARIAASSREEAKELAQKMAEDEEFGLELEEVHDVRLDYVSANPTRFYLIADPKSSSVSATTRVSDGQLPREPSDDDNRSCRKLGYAMSWAQPEGGA